MSIWHFTWLFLHFSVIICCSWYRLFIWLWSYTICQGFIFRYFPSYLKSFARSFFIKLNSIRCKRRTLNLRRNSLHECNQRVVLNSQIPFSELTKTGVPQGSIFGPPLLLINDCFTLTIYRTAFNLLAKFFLTTYLFFHVFDKCKSQSVWNYDLQVIRNWTFKGTLMQIWKFISIFVFS